MMHRKILVYCLLLIVICFNYNANAQYGKSEVGIAYGCYSYYTMQQGGNLSASSGIPMVFYRYYLSNIVTIGLTIGNENIDNWGSLITFAPEFTFRYLDTKDNRIRVRLYGAVAYGLCVFDDKNTNPGHTDYTGARLWGFQFTPIGIRIGRKFAGFAEIGLGYKGLINAGLSYRFRTVKRSDIREH